MSKRTASLGLGSLATGAVTALTLAVQSGLAAVVGVIIAREFGRTAETDGFFASYAVFIVLTLAANAMRVTVLPPLARARDEGRLSAETASYARALAAVAVPLALVGTFAASPLAALLTGFGPPTARAAAASTLPWLVVAALGQLAAGLLASALAALDDYVTPALGYVSGSIVGLALILVLIGAHGIDVVAWGMALNAATATLIMAGALWRRARIERMPSCALRAQRGGVLRRLTELASSAALPLALQAVYVVCLPFAARGGEGAVSSFGYAYLLASAIVAVTASSLGLVTAVPLTRMGLGDGRAARHIVASAWVGLLTIGLTAGVFALAGEAIIEALLGSSYASETGAEVGRLVAVLSPWAVASVGVSVTFPLLFVHGRGWWLPLLSVGVVALHVPLAVLGEAVLGLDGLALSLAVTMSVILGVMLAALGSARRVGSGLAVATAIVGVLALVAFVPPWLLLGPIAAAAVGASLYAFLVVVLRPPPLREAWRYLRALT